MKRTIIGLTVALLVLAVIYFYINRKVEPSNVQLPTVSIEKVKIGMVTFPGYAPFYLAKEKNLFEGVDIELVRIEAIGDLRAALKSGAIDIYLATPDIFQSTDQTEPPGIAFLAVDESHGADGVAVSSGITDISQLKGKKVGAEPGFPPYFILQFMLNKANLTLADINFKDLSSQDAGNAFVAKSLDAVGTYEPYLSKSVSLRKGSKVLISSKDLSGLIVDFAFASEKFIKEKPEVLKKIAEGWFKAVEYWQTNQDESATIMGKAFGVSKEEMIDFKSGVSWLTLVENQKLFDTNTPENAFTTFDLVGDILVKNKANGFRVYSKDKLTNNIIQSIK